MILFRRVLCSQYNLVVQVRMWAKQQLQRIQSTLSALETEREELQQLLHWIFSAEEFLNAKEQEPLPEDIELTSELINQHTVLMSNTSKHNL